MLSSTHDKKVIFHVCNVRIVHVWKTKVTVFQYTVVPPDVTPFRSDFSYYATFFLSTNVLYTVKHPLNATSPLPRHATFKSWHYLATSL